MLGQEAGGFSPGNTQGSEMRLVVGFVVVASVDGSGGLGLFSRVSSV